MGVLGVSLNYQDFSYPPNCGKCCSKWPILPRTRGLHSASSPTAAQEHLVSFSRNICACIQLLVHLVKLSSQPRTHLDESMLAFSSWLKEFNRLLPEHPQLSVTFRWSPAASALRRLHLLHTWASRQNLGWTRVPYDKYRSVIPVSANGM